MTFSNASQEHCCFDAGRNGTIVLAATSESEAVRIATAQGISVSRVLTRADIKRGLGELMAAVRESGADVAIALSADWTRQTMPQLYEAALLAIPVRARFVVDGRSGTIRPLHRRAMLSWIAQATRDTAAALVTVGSAASVFYVGHKPRHGIVRPSATSSNWVMAIWPGGLDSKVGGSLTHISGVVDGLKQLGFRIGLVTTTEPPAQLADLVDDFEITQPVSRGARLSSDVLRLASNATIARAAHALGERTRPAFVYQRHTGFLFCGPDVARRLHAPLALEWNGSEVWARAEWERPPRIARSLNWLHCRIEAHVAQSAAVILAVSDHAATMARDAGADSPRIIVVPNATDTAEIQSLIAGISPRRKEKPLIGWIGSFGPWHGAEILVEAAAELAGGVDVLMIGDGRERSACESIARTLGINHCIEWAGSLPHQEAVRRLAACDILASPHVELPGQAFFGSPTKLFEYMAIGRPIVASDLEQLGQVLVDGKTALLVQPGDSTALADAISRIQAMPDRGVHLGEAASREAQCQHNWLHRAIAVVGAVDAYRARFA